VASHIGLGYTGATLFLMRLMTHTSIKTVLNVFLVIAFLSMQFSSAHIHLAENHQHDGSQHAHKSRGHSHALSDHHEDAFDSSQSPADYRVVEISQESALQACNSDHGSELIFTLLFELFTPLQVAIRPGFSNTYNHQASWLSYSNVRLRAPPVFIS